MHYSLEARTHMHTHENLRKIEGGKEEEMKKKNNTVCVNTFGKCKRQFLKATTNNMRK